MEKGEDYEILKTNLQPFFWRKVKNIIRQNKKDALLEFLFGKAELTQDQTLGLIPHIQDQIQSLKNQVSSLEQKIIELEQEAIASCERSEQNQTLNLKSVLSELLKHSQTSKIDQH